MGLNMSQQTILQIIKELLEEGMRTDPQKTIQLLLQLLKDLAITEPQQDEHDLSVFEKYRHVLYQIVKELEHIKSFIASNGLGGVTTKELYDYLSLSSELSPALIRERLEMLIFNKSIKQGKKRMGVYVSNVYYII